MDWLKELILHESVARTIMVYCVVIFLGVFLGKIKIFGISLGITFVLFAGITLGHFGFSVNHQILFFIRDFGLILFVFFIGLQVGPGFFASFRKGGMWLNILAAVIVISGAAITLMIHFVTGDSMAMLVGVMSGAVTNTPGLGAAQNALAQVSTGADPSSVPDIGLGYAVAYPFGVLGIIITMFILRKLFRINIADEADAYEKSQNPSGSSPEKISLIVTGESFFNKTIPQISDIVGEEFVISRVLHEGRLQLASSSTIIHEGDTILVVAPKKSIRRIAEKIGKVSTTDHSLTSGLLCVRRILVTNRGVFGKTIGSLMLRSKYNVNITRIYRSGIDLVASPGLRLQMGDKLTIVGDDQSLDKATGLLGNSVKQLNEPNLVPVFVGIFLGVVLGSIPVYVPGIINPVKLGLAGGPLIVAILLSKYGYRFSLVSYTTPSANLMMRETGIVLFLSSVGILSGEQFISTLTSGEGFIWMGYGALVTFIPILLTGFVARYIMKINYLEICGLLSGSMTDPPALAYANSIALSDAPSVAYASVYPLVMFLRIFAAQILILAFA
jgi:putative transport protein